MTNVRQHRAGLRIGAALVGAAILAAGIATAGAAKSDLVKKFDADVSAPPRNDPCLAPS